MKLPGKFMIVEDELITQRYLSDILRKYDICDIVCHDNAKDALAAAKKDHFEMIIMDLNIKGPVDGLVLAKQILELYNVPIVFITAYTESDILEEMLDLAPYGFIAKPFSSVDVEATLQIAYQRFLAFECALKEFEPEEDNEITKINNKYVFEKKSGRLYQNNIPVKLSLKQNRLIEILVDHKNEVVSHEILFSMIWEDKSVTASSLRTLVYTVKKILPDLPIASHSKVGYTIKTQK